MTKGTEVPLSWRLVTERVDGMGLARQTSTGSAGVRISSLVSTFRVGHRQLEGTAMRNPKSAFTWHRRCATPLALSLAFDGNPGRRRREAETVSGNESMNLMDSDVRA